MSKKNQVTVTGASGFLASHCIIQLLTEGYSVKGTIRDMGREKSLRAIYHENVEFSDEQLTFVEVDLMSDRNWDEAMKDSAYVLHIASPFITTLPKDPDTLIKPAIEGALRALRFARKNKIQRVVMTSSMAAISYGHPRPMKTSVLDENSWTDVNGDDVTPYIASKTLAEKAAWDFIRNQAEDELELVTINPSAILGPVLEKDYGSSATIIKKVLDRAIPGLPHMGFQVVDVRDVATAHLKAMTLPGAAGKRIAVTDRFVWFEELAAILAKEFTSMGYRIPRKTIPDFMIKIFSWFDPETRSVMNEIGIKRELSNERMRNLLGIKPIPAKDSILVTGHTLISHGLIKKK